MIVTPETNFGPNHLDKNGVVIFLAGSIDNGRAVNWQPHLASALDYTFNRSLDSGSLPLNRLVIANPRRTDWDTKAGEAAVEKQILWEQAWLDEAKVVFFHFAAGSQAPISLLELGLVLSNRDKSVVVNCPETFYRYTNVRVMCERYHISFSNRLSPHYSVPPALYAAVKQYVM